VLWLKKVDFSLIGSVVLTLEQHADNRQTE